jgi:hypothetical protein
MHPTRWLVRFSMSAALLLTSALCGGWKWETFLH